MRFKTTCMSIESRPQTSKYRVSLVFLVLISLHLLLLALALFTTVFQGTWLEAFGLTAVVVPYVLHLIGLPVLDNNGMSGWGWSSPTLLGWILSGIVWFFIYWSIALGVERLIRRLKERNKSSVPFS